MSFVTPIEWSENAQIVKPVQPQQAPKPKSSDKLEQGVSGTVTQEL